MLAPFKYDDIGDLRGVRVIMATSSRMLESRADNSTSGNRVALAQGLWKRVLWRDKTRTAPIERNSGTANAVCTTQNKRRGD